MKKNLIAMLMAIIIVYVCTGVTCADDTDLVNIAPLAIATSRPGGSFLERITDGSNGLGYSDSGNSYIFNKNYYFRFTEAQPIRKIRFTLPTNYYSIWADTTGDGIYNQELLSVNNGPTSALWHISNWTYGEWIGGPVNIYGLRMDKPGIYKFTKSGFNGNPPQIGEMVYQWNTEGVRQHRSGTITAIDDTYVWVQISDGEGYNWGNSGWLAASSTNSSNRWVYSAVANANPERFLYEFEIYADMSELSSAAITALNTINNPTLEAGVPVLSAGSLVQVASPVSDEQYLKGMYIEVWMMDLGGWIGSNPRGDLRNWSQYQSMVSRLKNIGANFVWLMPTRSGWVNGTYTQDWYNSEVLWPSNYIASSSPENYLEIMADALHADGIMLFAGDRPAPGWTAKAGISQEDLWEGAVSEMAASGLDGVAVVFDEAGSQESGSQLNKYTAAANAAHAVNPNILTFTNLGMSYTFPRFSHNVDVDLFGTEGYFTLDDPLGHWAPAFHTEEMIGANPNRRTIITQNTAWAPAANNPLFYETFTPVCLYGPSLSVAFHGGDAISYWRLMFKNDGYTDAHIPKGYSMLDTLATWGGKEAEVPNDILVLETNRQNERFSYYDYVYKYLLPFPDTVLTGYFNTQAVYEILLKAGLPYQVRYVDYPEEFPNLSDVKAIVLPFAYECNDWGALFPQATVNYLQSAANSGVKIIVLNREGTPTYSGYSSLIQSPNVTVVPDDLSYGLTPTIRNHILDPILSALGNDRPAYLNAFGQDVELASMEGTGKHAGNKYLLVINWENHSVTVDVGITMAAGNYKVLQRDLTDIKTVLLDGRSILTAEDVAKFRVDLDAGGARIFYVSSYHNYGDVSGDGEITAYDAALTAQAAVELISLTAEQTKAADVNGDSEVSAYDAALIAQRAVGLIEKFPVEEG